MNAMMSRNNDRSWLPKISYYYIEKREREESNLYEFDDLLP
jgi:hypothetical protein